MAYGRMHIYIDDNLWLLSSAIPVNSEHLQVACLPTLATSYRECGPTDGNLHGENLSRFCGVRRSVGLSAAPDSTILMVGLDIVQLLRSVRDLGIPLDSDLFTNYY